MIYGREMEEEYVTDPPKVTPMTDERLMRFMRHRDMYRQYGPSSDLSHAEEAEIVDEIARLRTELATIQAERDTLRAENERVWQYAEHHPGCEAPVYPRCTCGLDPEPAL